MKSKLILSALVASLAVGTAFADCTFTYVNKSSHPVTVQGYFLEGGDAQTPQGWVTVAPTQQATQVRQGKKCSSIYQHSGQVATRVDLKNNSGYWVGNKGFLFAADRSYSHYSGDFAKSDDGQNVTLSNGSKISGKEFKVFICDSSISSDNCTK
jgi:hypothetical protein